MVDTTRARLARISRAAALVAVVALAAAGCGSTDAVEAGAKSAAQADTADTADSGDSAESSSFAGQASETGQDPGSGSDGSDPKTLQEYLGVAAGRVTRGSGFATGGFDTDAFAAEQQLIQVEIQRCMLAQGFTYTPTETEGFRFFAANADAGLSAAEYAETNGFGISTRFDALFSGDVDLGDTTDANAEHLATLSEAEADAWQLALRGQPPERNDEGQLIDPETGEPIEGRGRTAGGCRGEAELAVRGDLSQLDDLASEFEALQQRIDSDPRITEINRDWADCMTGAGFAYQTIDQARDDFESQMRPLMRSFVEAAGGAGQGGGRGPNGSGLIEVIAENGLTGDQEFELQQLKDLEIATAVASQECAGDTAAEIAEISARYEAEFVAEHRATLEALGS